MFECFFHKRLRLSKQLEGEVQTCIKSVAHPMWDGWCMDGSGVWYEKCGHSLGIVVQGERDIVVTMVFASWIYCNYNT